MPHLLLTRYHSAFVLAATGGPSLPRFPAASAPGGWTLLVWLAGAMVVVSAIAMVYAVARRRMAETPPLSLAEERVLRRPYLIWLALYLALAIYGSLVPLDFRSVGWATAVEQFRNIRYLQLDAGARADWVANILLFIPLAYLATAVLTLGMRARVARAAAVGVVAVCCVALSVAIEFVQIWFWPRTVSLNDILAESIGGVIGAVLWVLLGPTLHGWLAAYAKPQRRRTQVDQLLEFYLVGLVIYSLLPLDLTINPVDLYHKYRAGKVLLLPFAGIQWDIEQLYSLLTDVATFIPVGMYCATAFTTERQPVRSLWASTLWGAGFAAVIELAQLFVIEHYTSITAVGVAAVGCWIGAALMQRLRSAEPNESANLLVPTRWPRETARRAAGLCLALMGIYSMLLVAAFCYGGDWQSDPVVLAQRFEGFWRPPLSALYWGREYNALSDVLRKILFFAPLGGLGALAVWGASPPPFSRRWHGFAVLLYAAGVAFTIEMLQVYLPLPSGAGHVADVGDVLLCTAGAALGMFLTRRVLMAPSDVTERDDHSRRWNASKL